MQLYCTDICSIRTFLIANVSIASVLKSVISQPPTARKPLDFLVSALYDLELWHFMIYIFYVFYRLNQVYVAFVQYFHDFTLKTSHIFFQIIVLRFLMDFVWVFVFWAVYINLFPHRARDLPTHHLTMATLCVHRSIGSSARFQVHVTPVPAGSLSTVCCSLVRYAILPLSPYQYGETSFQLKTKFIWYCRKCGHWKRPKKPVWQIWIKLCILINMKYMKWEMPNQSVFWFPEKTWSIYLCKMEINVIAINQNIFLMLPFEISRNKIASEISRN